ncbi:MAG: flagellar hook-length control protein FliK [Gammaproteobacteria bacterium]|nr:flagellar hook-length control protein FliK [Gammaproteobacteria bacterium]
MIRPDGAGVATPGRSLAPGQFELPLALNDARWDNAFANRVSWVVSEGMSAARLNVYPPELGQIELRVTFSNDQANVQFGVQHASVRDAVEQALPRLREMFEAAGIALGDTSVATQEQRDADPRAAGGDGEAGGAAQHGDAVLEELPIGDARAGHHHGMIDAFV